MTMHRWMPIPGLARHLLAVLLVLAAGPALAEDWKTGRLRDLTLAVPESWHFIHDPGQGISGYTPDARRSNTAAAGVVMLQDPIANVIPDTAITSRSRMTIADLGAEVFSIMLPVEIGMQGWWVDFDEPAPDGAHMAISLVAPVASWDQWLPVYEYMLGSVRVDPMPGGFAVPDLVGDWFVKGGAGHLMVQAQDDAAWFTVAGAGGPQALVRLGPSELAIVEGADQGRGAVDASGQRIDWADGTVWTRQPAGADAQPGNPAWRPEGPVLTAALQSIAAVRNGPTQPSVFSLSEPVFLDSLMTYHWNDGRGSAPGQIALRDASGAELGRWQATGSGGQGGVPDAYWTVQPQIVLLPGDYTVIDSDPATWATNAEVGERGIFEARVQRVVAVAPPDVMPPVVAPPVVPVGPTAAPQLPQFGSDPPDTATADTVGTALFAGRMTPDWRPLSVAGGNFDRFARVDAGALRVDVPPGNSWGKTGIWSAAPMVDLADGRPAALRFGFDPAGTDSFVLALGSRDDPEEWAAHILRFVWSRNPDGSGGTAQVLVRQRLVARIATGPEAPETVEIRLDPRGVATAVMPDGQRLETRLPDGVLTEPLYIYALAHAPEANRSAKMALRAIDLERGGAPALALTPYPDPATETVLFDGTMGLLWVPHSAGGASYDAAARLMPEGLVVDVAANSGWGVAGILSPGPVVWLDRLQDDGAVEVVFAVDPGRSDGFAFALAQPGYGGVQGNGPGAPSVIYSWVRAKDAASAVAEVHVYPHPGGDFDRQEVAPATPSEVRMLLRPGEVTVSAAGMAPVTRPFPTATNGVGLHVYAYSVVPEVNAPTRMLLKSILVIRTPAPDAPPDATPAAPAPGVAPLPVATAFAGQPGAAWEPIGIVGGNFDAFARYRDGALVVSVPEGNSWGKTGLMSAEPLLRTDPRILRTPTRIEITLDPAQRQNMVFALSDIKQPDMWLNHRAWYTFSFVAERNVWLMGIHQSPYQDWSREISADWVAQNWDGRLWIDIGPDWTALAVPGGPKLRGYAPFSAHQSIYATVVAHPPREGQAAELALRGMSVGLLTPDGMNAVDRWTLIDPQAFDGQGFLHDLATLSPAASLPEMKE